METAIRLGAFVVVFGAMAAAEWFWPRRAQLLTRRKRWPHHIGIAVLGILLVRFSLPMTLAGFAVVVNHHQWGILPLINLPFFIQIMISLIALDVLIYAQHVAFHHIPVLWRLHRVHHADTEMDVSTALRFHPLEILISMGIKFAAVLVIGVPAEAIVVFEIMLNACAMFNHGNLYLPASIDKVLRFVLVTPDMHRVHHSVISRETNSNYGFSLAAWDRLFRTYRPQPELGHDGMMIGLQVFRDADEADIGKLLTQPFR